jgi:hypothetical protein
MLPVEVNSKNRLAAKIFFSLGVIFLLKSVPSALISKTTQEDNMPKARISPALRTRVLARDNYICRACGFGGSPAYEPFLDCDHAIAERNGGETQFENLQCLCKACNIAKAGADWTFTIRQASVPSEVWAHNHKVMKSAFFADTAKRLRKLQ